MTVQAGKVEDKVEVKLGNKCFAADVYPLHWPEPWPKPTSYRATT